MRLTGRHRQVPLARSEGLLIEDIDSEKVIYDTERKQAALLDAARGGQVFDNCDGKTRVRDLPQRASELLGDTVSEDHVRAALAQLDQRGLLATSSPRISRRDMIHKSAARSGAAAAAGMLIFTVDPPMAHAQGDECSLAAVQCKKLALRAASPVRTDAECLCLMEPVSPAVLLRGLARTLQMRWRR